eukprot:11599280-Alexandrium_andersonii.AAC.1
MFPNDIADQLIANLSLENDPPTCRFHPQMPNCEAGKQWHVLTTDEDTNLTGKETQQKATLSGSMGNAGPQTSPQLRVTNSHASVFPNEGPVARAPRPGG